MGGNRSSMLPLLGPQRTLVVGLFFLPPLSRRQLFSSRFVFSRTLSAGSMSREELAARFSRPSPPRRRGEFRMLRAQEVVVGRSRVRKVVERTRNRHSATQARANRYTGGEEAGCAGRAQQDNETAWGWGGRKELPPEREQRRRASACRAGSGAWVRARGSFADNRRSPGPAAPGPRPPRHSPSASRPMPLSLSFLTSVLGMFLCFQDVHLEIYVLHYSTKLRNTLELDCKQKERNIGDALRDPPLTNHNLLRMLHRQNGMSRSHFN